MNKRRLIILIAPLALIFSLYLAYRALTFRVVSTDPRNTSISVITPYIDINFNKELSAEDIKVEASSDIIARKEVSKNIIRIYYQNLEIDKSYEIKLQSVKSLNGKVITNKIIKFTAKDIPYDKLSGKQKKAILDIQDTYSPYKNDPILNHLPYGTTSFSLDVVVGEDPKPTLKARLLLSRSDVSTNKEAAIESAKKDVIDYLKSLNLNPDSYKIDYVVVEPNLY